MASDNHLSIMANEAKQANRDERKEVAIVLYDAGLEAKEIAKELGISTRTANRYLESHIEITPETIKTGLKGKPDSRKKRESDVPRTRYALLGNSQGVRS